MDAHVLGKRSAKYEDNMHRKTYRKEISPPTQIQLVSFHEANVYF